MKKKKILLICNESNSVINFRRELIEYLKQKDFAVSLIVGDDKRNADIDKLGIEYKVIPFKNRSTNPFALFSLQKKFGSYIQEQKPDIVFTFQLKPNIIGPLAASKVGVKKIFSMVEGLGDPFQPHNFKGKVIRWIVSNLYRRSFKKINQAIFLNNDDLEEFIDRNIVPAGKGFVIDGIGIDTTKYPFFDFVSPKREVILFARLIKNKGIIDFCRVAQKVKETRSDISFKIYGEEAEITAADLQPYTSSGAVTYCGFTMDVVGCLKDARILSSCSSYREGFPRIILEAMACGRPTIASNVVGNRQAVVDGVTGYLLPVHNIDAFAKKIIELIDDDNELLKLGRQARDTCVRRYDSGIVNKFLLSSLGLI